ncbi:MAG TPA: 30S ribosomal protein S21 [Chloroflexota bacterium]|nr:30S ribosomal protein S21 [Chloroflexota bacterium]
MFVSIREGETQEALLRRFQRSIQNSGLLREVKSKRFFVSNGEKARIAARKSAARYRRRARKEAGLETGTGPRRGRPGQGGPGGPRGRFDGPRTDGPRMDSPRPEGAPQAPAPAAPPAS